MPSVFGKNDLKFSETDDVLVSDTNEHEMEICKKAIKCLENKRPVLVFFEDKKKLEDFFNSKQF